MKNILNVIIWFWICEYFWKIYRYWNM